MLAALITSCGTIHSSNYHPDLAPCTIRGGDHDLPFGSLKVWVTAVEGEKKVASFMGSNRKIPVLAKSQFFNIKGKLTTSDGDYKFKALIQANLSAPGHYFVNGSKEGNKMDLWIEQEGTGQIVSKVNTQELL